MLEAFSNIFKIPELKKKVLITLGLIAIYRIGAYIPVPGIDSRALSYFFAQIARSQGGSLFGIMNMFSGGAISRATIFALGIMPYISASIILQLLTTAIPYLEKLSKEGEAGRRKIIQFTRYGTILLAVIQSFFIALWLENPANFPHLGEGMRIVPTPGWGFRLLTILTLTSGTAFIMWLGEQITERGIGNGISIIITVGILSRFPTAMFQLAALFSPNVAEVSKLGPLRLVILPLMMIGVVFSVVMITQGQRKIPVQYAKRVVGRKVYGGQSTYIPLKVNQAGVIPIIFAQSVILFPATIAGLVNNPFLQNIANSLTRGGAVYTIIYTLFIIFFCYFYTAVTFNPADIADNMKRYGGFVPGIRPGRPTAEFFDHVMTRITLAGALFLAIIAVLPDFVGKILHVPYLVASFLGGTGLLIIVGVLLDTMKQVESHLVSRHYEGFLRKGRLRSRR